MGVFDTPFSSSNLFLFNKLRIPFRIAPALAEALHSVRQGEQTKALSPRQFLAAGNTRGQNHANSE
jgi:hypothetical protein